MASGKIYMKALDYGSKVLEYVKKHPEATATIIVGLAVIIDNRFTKSDSAKQVASQIEAANFKLDEKLSSQMGAIKTEIKQEILDSKGIALGTAYACLKALAGEKKKIATWIAKIDGCVKSSGTDCEGVKNIPINE